MRGLLHYLETPCGLDIAPSSPILEIETTARRGEKDSQSDNILKRMTIYGMYQLENILQGFLT